MRRIAALAALALACGGSSGRRTSEVPDDLDVDPEVARNDEAHPDEAVPLASPDADAGMPQVKVDVVADHPDGVRIDLAVRDADVADVLRMIAAAAKVSLVVADDVRATVTLEVRNVTWRQAIDVIAHLEGLEVSEADGIVSVRRAAPAS